MIEWEAVIGLEVHAQLSTASKLFCGCPNRFGAEPNSAVCPVCLGHPGALPVVNRRAVELAVRFGLAVGASVRRRSLFARKNYFYPDLPKNYQISQYELPLCEGGEIVVRGPDGARAVGIERIHLEEDAGKSRHPERDRSETTRIDLNRCGVPLVEIVSRPELHSPSEAHRFLSRLRQLLVWLDVCDGNMEEGSLRCDANVSVRTRGAIDLGTRTELKNLNSFRFVEKALAHEIDRQSRLLLAGGEVVQETLMWDEEENRSRRIRGKEEVHDYRYFPEPDLPPLVLTGEWIDGVGRSLPERPDERVARFRTSLSVSDGEADLLTSTRELADYFEGVVGAGADPRQSASWILTHLLGLLHGHGIVLGKSPVGPAALASLVKEVAAGRISGRQGKELLAEAVESGEDPVRIIERRGVVQVSDRTALEAWVDGVLDTHPDKVAGYLAGKEGLLRFFTGEVMKRSKGRANPRIVVAVIRDRLEMRGRR